MNDEQRCAPRQIANEVLDIFDQVTGNKLGRVVNISAEGLMLLSDNPVEAGSVYQLDVALPRLVKQRSRISFGAEAIWSSPSAQPGSYWTGFRIIDASDDDTVTIDQLLYDWHTLD